MLIICSIYYVFNYRFCFFISRRGGPGGAFLFVPAYGTVAEGGVGVREAGPCLDSGAWNNTTSGYMIVSYLIAFLYDVIYWTFILARILFNVPKKTSNKFSSALPFECTKDCIHFQWVFRFWMIIGIVRLYEKRFAPWPRLYRWWCSSVDRPPPSSSIPSSSSPLPRLPSSA